MAKMLPIHYFPRYLRTKNQPELQWLTGEECGHLEPVIAHRILYVIAHKGCMTDHNGDNI